MDNTVQTSSYEASITSATKMDFSKCNFVVGDPNATHSVLIPFGQLNVLFSKANDLEKREPILIDVIRNYIRKINYAELNDSFMNDDITEEDFYKQLATNKDKFVITLRDIKSDDDFMHMRHIISKIGCDLRALSTDEVAEMFSIKEPQLSQRLDKLNQEIK